MEELTVSERRLIDQRLGAIMNSPGGLEKIAQRMQSPIRYDLLYEGRIRQLLRVHTLSPGEPAIFDKDVRVPAVKLSKRGLPPVLVIESDRFEVDTFEIAVHPEIRYNELIYRRFDVLNRTQERAKSQIAEIEDEEGFSTINTASTAYNSAISETGSTGLLQYDTLARAFAVIESNRLIPFSILCHPYHMRDFRTWNIQTTGSKIFDEVTLYEVLKTGKMGKVWNANIITSVMCNPAKMYVMAAPELVGIMPIRSDVTVKPFDDVRKLSVTFACFENIGFSIQYSQGIQQISFASAPTEGWPTYGATG